MKSIQYDVLINTKKQNQRIGHRSRLISVPTQWSTSALSASTNTPLLDLHGAEYNALVQEIATPAPFSAQIGFV